MSQKKMPGLLYEKPLAYSRKTGIVFGKTPTMITITKAGINYQKSPPLQNFLLCDFEAHPITEGSRAGFAITRPCLPSVFPIGQRKVALWVLYSAGNPTSGMPCDNEARALYTIFKYFPNLPPQAAAG